MPMKVWQLIALLNEQDRDSFVTIDTQHPDEAPDPTKTADYEEFFENEQILVEPHKGYVWVYLRQPAAEVLTAGAATTKVV